jgi:molybdopterin adenylyltransferase
MTKAFVVTVSDRCARGEAQDGSGPAVSSLLREHGFGVEGSRVVPDEQGEIEAVLREAAAAAPLVVTTGGTGIGPRDVTPEATLAVCGRVLPGLGELMRAEGRRETPFAVLSRGVCGLLGQTVIVNVPGAPRGAVSSLRAVLPVLPHALALVAGEAVDHPGTDDAEAEDA